MIPSHFIAIALGYTLDRLIGDPPRWPHPVRWIGKFIALWTSLLNKGRYRFLKGMLLFFITVIPVVVVTFVIIVVMYEVHFIAGILTESVLIAIGLAQKSLADAARAVQKPLQQKDLAQSREQLSGIVGRDTKKLNGHNIARATIETVSENTLDGVTAPLFWAFFFGAPGLWLYKAVNTLDSMVGYRDERYEQFGKFSARMDDLVNYIPARITGLLMIVATRNKTTLPFKQRLQGWLREASKHSSVNSGYLEAATAWQLGIVLGGKNSYRGVPSERPEIGPKKVPLQAQHIQESIVQMHTVSFAFWLLFTVIGVVFYEFT